MKDFVVVKTFTLRLEADIAKGFLESEGIEAQVTADDRGGATPFPFQPSTTGVQLLVAEKNAEKAKKLLKSHEK